MTPVPRPRGTAGRVPSMPGCNAAVPAAAPWALHQPRFLTHASLTYFTAAGAKLAGAMLGVFCGCMLGLTPLFLSGSFFTAR